MDETHLTPKELAKRLKVEEQTLYTWRREGRGPTWFNVGRSIRYALADVEEWEEQKKEEAQAAG